MDLDNESLGDRIFESWWDQVFETEEPTGGGDVEVAHARSLARQMLFGGGPQALKLGRFRVLGSIGSGAMGVVYAAYDDELDRKVAVKLLRRPNIDGAGDTGRERLLREAKTIASLSHPNIVHVYDVGTLGELPYVAMEFVEGPTLRTWLGEASRSIEEILEVFVATGRALAAAHAQGVVHRDFKPENVMIGKDGRPRVLDFGLARLMSPASDDTMSEPGRTESPLASTLSSSASPARLTSLTHPGTAIGTPAYMAPEQHHQDPADARSDQFAFCVTLFEAAFGCRPFEGQTLSALAASKEGGRVNLPLADSETQSVPGWLRETIMRGLRPNPSDRFPTMDALVAALQSGQVRPRRSYATLALGVGALCTLAGVAGTHYFWPAEPASSAVALCEGAHDELAEVWNSTRASSLAEGFANASPNGASTWEAVKRAVESYGEVWTTMHTEACAATRLDGSQSDELLDIRMLCLRERLGSLDATLTQMGSADSGVVEHAADAVGQLRSVEPCADVHALMDRVPPPDDPRDRAKFDINAAKLQTAAAQLRLGKYEQSQSVATAAVDGARALGVRPQLAAALFVLGETSVGLGKPHDAERILLDAAWAAEAGRDDETAAEVWTQLLHLASDPLADKERIERWKPRATAAVARLDSKQHDADLANVLGVIHVHAGEIDDAIEQLETSLALRRDLHPQTSRKMIEPLSNLAAAYTMNRDYELALSTFQEVLRAQKIVLPPEHIDSLITGGNIATVLSHLGRDEEALVQGERTLAKIVKYLGPDHPHAATAHVSVGYTLADLGRANEGVVHVQRAARIQEERLGPDNENLGFTLMALGSILARAGRVEEAIQATIRCKKIAEQARGRDHPNAIMALRNLGDLHIQSGQLDLAVEELNEALVRAKKALPPEHPDIATIERSIVKATAKPSETKPRHD